MEVGFWDMLELLIPISFIGKGLRKSLPFGLRSDGMIRRNQWRLRISLMVVLVRCFHDLP